MKFKLTIHPTAVYLDKDKLDDNTVANIAFASKFEDSAIENELQKMPLMRQAL